MTTITITPERADTYRAVTGDKESTGRTAGEALDALASQLADDESGTLVTVQNRKADPFFDAARQARLTELIGRRDGGALAPEEAGELESLIEAELDGARDRADALLRELKP
jgi:predicted Zn-dependent protease with MMP-like domain